MVICNWKESSLKSFYHLYCVFGRDSCDSYFRNYYCITSDTIIGNLKDYFYRFEFQGAGAVGNKLHVHSGIFLYDECDVVLAKRISCDSTLFLSRLFKGNYELLQADGCHINALISVTFECHNGKTCYSYRRNAFAYTSDYRYHSYVRRLSRFMRDNDDRANLGFPGHFLDVRFVSLPGGTLDVGRQRIFKEVNEVPRLQPKVVFVHISENDVNAVEAEKMAS